MAMFDFSDLYAGIDDYAKRCRKAVAGYAEIAAKDCETYAKMHRPWQDRTGNARQSLHGYVEDTGDTIRICLDHGVEYGRQLEYGHERRYAIIQPTLRSKRLEIMKGVKKILG